MKAYQQERQGDIKYRHRLDHARRVSRFPREAGVSTNVASFVSADDGSHPRDRRTSQPRPDAPTNWNGCAGTCGRRWRRARWGSTSALIYAPGTFATTDELIELAKVASQRAACTSRTCAARANRLLEAIDEVIDDRARGATFAPRSIT